MKNKNFGIGLIVLSIVLGGILIGGGVAYWQKNLTKKVTKEVKVEWLTYEDKDLSFVYPKTFLGTSEQETSDENSRGTKWEVFREDNTIYIRPNFESPVAEFGSTYEIQVFDNLKDAEKLQTSIEYATGSKNLCLPVDAIKIIGYSVCAFEQEYNDGLGGVGKYYEVIPELKNGIQKGPWIYIFDASGGMYSNYVNSTLLPSLNIK